MNIFSTFKNNSNKKIAFDKVTWLNDNSNLNKNTFNLYLFPECFKFIQVSKNKNLKAKIRISKTLQINVLKLKFKSAEKEK